jgi:putative SOS response-associated peptidase YedK
MCGRFTQKSRPQELVEAFELDVLPEDLGPRYNIAPTQPVLVIANRPGPRRAETMAWGLTPAWSPRPGSPTLLVNARSETAATKPSFRDALRYRRGLLLMDGFYEWQTNGKHKQPFWFFLPDQRPFAVAALWQLPPLQPAGQDALPQLCLLTTGPCATVAPIHDRMPVILPPAAWPQWLGQTPMDQAQLSELMLPWQGEMHSRAVGTRVNDARIEGPQLIEPSAPIAPRLL